MVINWNWAIEKQNDSSSVLRVSQHNSFSAMTSKDTMFEEKHNGVYSNTLSLSEQWPQSTPHGPNAE